MGGWAERFFCTTSRREQNVCTASRRDAQKNTPDRRYYSCFASERSPEEHPRSHILFVFCIGTTSTRTPNIAATICVLHQKGHQRTTPDRSYYSCFASERTAEEHPRSQILFVFCIGKTSKMTPKEHLPGGSQKWSPSHPENFIRFLLFLLVRRAQKVLQEGFLHFRSKKWHGVEARAKCVHGVEAKTSHLPLCVAGERSRARPVWERALGTMLIFDCCTRSALREPPVLLLKF